MKTLRQEIKEISDRQTGRCLYDISECGVDLQKLVLERIKMAIRYTALDVDDVNEIEKKELLDRVIFLEHELDSILLKLEERGIELED